MKRDITSLPGLDAGERVAYGKDPNQFFDVWRPKDRKTIGAAVMIHGGFWQARYDLRHASYLCAALADNGIGTANLEYRRVGQPGGGWPGTFEDVLAGTKAARQRLGSAPVVLGHSSGGHLALRAAAEPVGVRGVIALAPVADLQLAYKLNLGNGAVVELMGGTPATIAEHYREACPSQYAAPVPRIVLHGTEDDIVPISLSRKFVKAREKDPMAPKLIEVPGADHFDWIDPESQVWPVLLKSVRELLRG